MSASESNKEAFIEDDAVSTKFTFGEGGVPVYIGLIWVSFIIGLIVFSLTYIVPDLASWFGQ